MVEVRRIDGSVLFSYDENTTTLKEEIVKHEYLSLQFADLKGANFSYVDLRGRDFEGADLSEAVLSNADLRGARLEGTRQYKADLTDADLRQAHLRKADFRGANLRGADLRNADLVRADLRKANLICADLRGAYFIKARLRGADLRSADLRDTDLRCADLSDADLRYADFRGTNLSGTRNPPDLPMACPTEGSFIAWKKVNDIYIVKLEIPSDARRSSATTEKCRCDKAKVLEITNMETGEKVDEVVNSNYTRCVYKVGKMVYPNRFDNNRWKECSHGIHFFMTEEEAKNY